eukprot:595293-Prymnesium_polylepis.1
MLLSRRVRGPRFERAHASRTYIRTACDVSEHRGAVNRCNCVLVGYRVHINVCTDRWNSLSRSFARSALSKPPNPPLGAPTCVACVTR